MCLCCTRVCVCVSCSPGCPPSPSTPASASPLLGFECVSACLTLPSTLELQGEGTALSEEMARAAVSSVETASGAAHVGIQNLGLKVNTPSLCSCLRRGIESGQWRVRVAISPSDGSDKPTSPGVERAGSWGEPCPSWASQSKALLLLL